jgi:phospholipid transport system substrate-binding protein
MKMAAGFARGAMLVFALALAPLPAIAQDVAPAQSFVQTNVQQALAILQDQSVSPDARRARMHDFLLSLLDTKRIAAFTLGSAQDTASPADLAAYSDAFRDFMVANYDAELGAYAGQTLKVTGSIQHAPGDFVVSAELSNPAANGKTAQEVALRVVDEGGKLYIVDASVEGIWLALAIREDFQSFLKAHNNDVPALTAHLKDMTAQLAAQGGH